MNIEERERERYEKWYEWATKISTRTITLSHSIDYVNFRQCRNIHSYQFQTPNSDFPIWLGIEQLMFKLYGHKPMSKLPSQKLWVFDVFNFWNWFDCHLLSATCIFHLAFEWQLIYHSRSLSVRECVALGSESVLLGTFCYAVVGFQFFFLLYSGFMVWRQVLHNSRIQTHSKELCIDNLAKVC